ncbi:MAG: CRISPR-associated endonuclease Cas2 [Promethearchaeota archaeon]
MYDIPVDFDPIRTKISDILLSYGLIRLNYSVFFGELTRNIAEEISMKLTKLTAKVPGDVRLFRLCQACYKETIVIKSKFKDGYEFNMDILSL